MLATTTRPTRYPTRFRDPAENQDFFLKLLDKFFIDKKITADELARYGDYLWLGDPLADALAAKNFEMGQSQATKMFDAALSGHMPENAPPELKNLIEHAETKPAWLDTRQLDIGARLSQRSGILAEYVLSCISLMGGYRSGAANKPIAFTGALEYKASRRLAETAKFGFDVTRPRGLARSADGFKAALKVRMLHAQVRLMLDRSPAWRHSDWGLPINQADLVATNILFSGVYVTGLRVLGLNISREEAEGVIHLWRYIGYLMGVDENLLPKTEADAQRMAYLAGVTQPKADADSKALGRALMQVPMERAETAVEKVAAWFDIQLRSGFTRLVLGDLAGDDLGLPNTPFKYTPLFTTPAVFAIDTLRRIVPGATDWAAALGGALQRRFIDKPLGQHVVTYAAPPALHRIGTAASLSA